MFNKPLEEKQVGLFLYRRFEGVSKILDTSTKVGVIYPSSDPAFVPLESIYFFHGGDSDDQLFVQSNFLDLLSEKAKALLIERKIQIVLPFIGLTYLKTPHDRAFMEEVIPWAERSIPNPKNHPRLLHGVSMGGTAALNILFKELDSFSGIGLHFTGLIQFNPFDDQESKDYQTKTKITDQMMGILRYCYQTPFKDYAEFQVNDPFQLARVCDLQKLRGKKIYFDVGEKDDFGLHLGARQFDQLLQEMGVVHEINFYEGGHNLEFIQKHLHQSFDFLLK